MVYHIPLPVTASNGASCRKRLPLPESLPPSCEYWPAGCAATCRRFKRACRSAVLVRTKGRKKATIERAVWRGETYRKVGGIGGRCIVLLYTRKPRTLPSPEEQVYLTYRTMETQCVPGSCWFPVCPCVWSGTVRGCIGLRHARSVCCKRVARVLDECIRAV